MEQDIARYLAATEVVDWQAPAVLRQARALSMGQRDPVLIARCCFEWVRDAIDHSNDRRAQQLTCSASEVLAAGHGLCYAKSHLLAALLRANGIPAGFDYQRLRDGDQYMLHGFNTLHLPEQGWYRVDARGNKPGVHARFEPPTEYLAWPSALPGEIDYRLRLAAPLPEVVSALRLPLTLAEVWPHLPSTVRMA